MIDYTPLIPPFVGVDGDTFNEVSAELDRQINKWGLQHHPDHTGPGFNLAGYKAGHAYNEGADMATLYKRINDRHVREDSLSWSVILQEELYEALAESDLDDLATELVQVAAVAVAWVRDIRMRQRDLWSQS